ncbi:nucleoside phosphorylase domain-containing protein [Aspergillus insuetus]
MEKSFPAVKWHFVVGIGGGVPSSEHDIRLGDVVVSTSVVQHDMGRTIQSGSKFESTAIVQRPSRSLMTAISLLQSDPYHTHDCLEPHIEQVTTLRPEYKVPGQHRDRLFEPHYEHEPGQRTCTGCTGPRVNRKPRSPGPRIHYGRIASGNQVIKDASKRDQLAQTSKAICFEMEGAGVMTTGRCLVIWGICDYADSHKNDEWHNYAAATAAAYTKFFVLRLPVLNREMVHLQKRTVACLDEVELSVKRVRYERD